MAVTAMAAAVLAADTSAMSLDPRGTGQVLIFPHYRVNAGNQTLIRVVNTTAAAKAIKVRFREGRNGRAAMAFNLYLTPFGSWTASAFSITDGVAGEPANLVTRDASCTAPDLRSSALPMLGSLRYAPFYSDQYVGLRDGAGPDTLDRTREGFFEMIEMGEVLDRERQSLTAITTGDDGLPNDCAAIRRAWLPSIVPDTANELERRRDDRSVRAARRTDRQCGNRRRARRHADRIRRRSHRRIQRHRPAFGARRRTAFAGFGAQQRRGHRRRDHRRRHPGRLRLSALACDRRRVGIADARCPVRRIHTHPNLGAVAEWVFTLPTKPFHTDEAIVGTTPIPPFSRVFPAHSGDGSAAADFTGKLFTREGIPTFHCEESPECDGLPGMEISQLLLAGMTLQFDYVSNVLRFTDLGYVQAPGPSPLLGSALAKVGLYPEYFVADGVIRIDLFAEQSWNGALITRHTLRPDGSGGVWHGLPIIGFAAMSCTNGELQAGLLANYAGASPYRARRRYLAEP